MVHQTQRTREEGVGQVTYHAPPFHIPDEDVFQRGHIREFPIENRVGRCAADKPKSLKIVLTIARNKFT